MRKRVYKRLRRAFNATFKRWENLINIPISLICMYVLYRFGWKEQVIFEVRAILIFAAIVLGLYGLFFLKFIVKPPAPKRGDPNFLISCKDAEVIPATRASLPPAAHKMRWVQVHTNFEINYITTINSLVLSLKGKPYDAYGWEPTTTQRMGPYPRYHHFQIPRFVDLTKHKAEIVVLTDKEDYGSVKFTIKQ